MCLNKLLVTSGAVMITVAFFTASQIPQQVESDFGNYVKSAGGVVSHTANFPDTYREISANRHLLQNAYLGVTGIVLLASGLFGMVIRKS